MGRKEAEEQEAEEQEIEEQETENGEEGKEKPKKRKALKWQIAGGVLLFLGIVFDVVLWRTMNNQKQAKEQYAYLAEMTNIVESPSPAPTEEPLPEETPDPLDVLREKEIPIPEKNVDFEFLWEEANEDIYAWLYIPDSTIDYPVLQHPTDDTFYLEYNMDGSKGRPGCIYTEGQYNSKDFTDPLTVMYGHNMNDGTMFAGLHRYEDSEFFDTHPYLYVYTPEKLLVYEVFAAYEYSNAHLLYGHDYTNQAAFQTYLKGITRLREMNRIWKEDVEVTVESHILTLSTCVYGNYGKRYLVQGVLVNDE